MKYLTKHPLYSTWCSIKTRCNNPNFRYYYRYGGRGIKICTEWENSFEQFIKDMGERPSKKHTIERIDNDKGYSPDNCRWATKQEQCNNTRRNRFYTDKNGITKSMTAWAKESDISLWTIRSRLDSGMSIDDALKQGDNRSARIFDNKDPVTGRFTKTGDCSVGVL